MLQERQAGLERLRTIIAQSGNGAVTFRDYMDVCLYDPEFGYYNKPKAKVGKDGDFYTSSSIGTIMGEMLVSHFAAVLVKENIAASGPWTIVEWGGGTGMLALHMLDELMQRYPERYESCRYISVEKSGYHREEQRKTLSSHPAKAEWRDGWSVSEVESEWCFVVANELLDAFPVHLVEYRGGKWHEVYVELNEDAERPIREKLVPLGEGPLSGYIAEWNIPEDEGRRAEINIGARDWMLQMLSGMWTGQLIAVDYGDSAEELYSDHRMKGTLMCYRNHVAFTDPYAYPGEQDMTSHVNFSACERAAADCGAVTRLSTQKQFLLDCGILHRLQPHAGTDPFGPEARKNRAIRQLLLSDQMSELFKVFIADNRRDN